MPTPRSLILDVNDMCCTPTLLYGKVKWVEKTQLLKVRPTFGPAAYPLAVAAGAGYTRAAVLIVAGHVLGARHADN